MVTFVTPHEDRTLGVTQFLTVSPDVTLVASIAAVTVCRPQSSVTSFEEMLRHATSASRVTGPALAIVRQVDDGAPFVGVVGVEAVDGAIGCDPHPDVTARSAAMASRRMVLRNPR
jgi:hypothetical protein